MSFQTPITIKDAIENIDQKKYLLPSIQREFVWKTEQIEQLFDSIMKGYPVGSFLFWSVEGQNISKYKFYEFIRDYHEKDNRHNPKANTVGLSSLTSILDGQQRLTSLFIGLKGSYTEKIPFLRWSGKNSFEKKELYLNLLKPSEETDYYYDIRFLSKKEIDAFDDEYHWFRIGDVLNFFGLQDILKYITDHNITSNFASVSLMVLYEQIVKTQMINFYLEKGVELDKVLNIFIRVNSGGTQLSYSDLLLSIASAQWKNEDAREEITQLVDELNDYGDFDFNKDIILKSCLVLLDFTEIAFKVDNFNSDNMTKIESEWRNIADALKIAVQLLASFGFNQKTLIANYVLIPIAYYIYKKGNPHNFVLSSKYQTDRESIRKFTIVSLLKRIFGGQPDDVLRPLREIIRSNMTEFPFTTIRDNLKATNKTMKFTEEEIREELLFTKYGNKYAFSLLSLLYPTLDYRNTFHQDHLFPRSIIKSQRKLKKLGLDDDAISNYIDSCDYIGNIQLIEGVPNMEKSDMEFEQWLNKTYKTPQEKTDYMNRHVIPKNINLAVDNFPEFLEKREELIVEKLKQLLL